jgi:hypothetical protein
METIVFKILKTMFKISDLKYGSYMESSCNKLMKRNKQNLAK